MEKNNAPKNKSTIEEIVDVVHDTSIKLAIATTLLSLAIGIVKVFSDDEL